MQELLCLDSAPSFLGIFDFSIAPPLLFYSYIPIMLLTIFVGFLIFVGDKKNLANRLFLGISLAFSFWIMSVLVQWTASQADIVMFAWQMLVVFEIAIYIFSLYFLYFFLNRKDVSLFFKGIGTVIFSGCIILLPTALNITGFDLFNCEGSIGELWHFIYPLEALCLVGILYIGFSSLKTRADKKQKSEAIFATVGMFLFLSIFFFSNIIGELTQVYEFNLFGPIGMALFLLFIGYLIITFKSFDIKILRAQALTFGMGFLVFSALFSESIEDARLILLATVGMLIIVGHYLVKGVKRETEQRLKLEQLTGDLKQANIKLEKLDKLKTEFLSLASHQLRSPLTAIKGYVSMLLDQSFGQITPEQKEAISRVSSSTEHLTKVVEDLLNVSKIEQGGLVFNYKMFSFTKLVDEVCREYEINFKNRGLGFSCHLPENGVEVFGDEEKLRQVISNFVDNSIKYTEKGEVNLSVTDENDAVTFKIQDTGIGLEKEEVESVFQKFQRGAGAKLDAGGSGLGLYLASKIIEGHHSKVNVFSEGKGKGTVFTFSLSKKSF